MTTIRRVAVIYSPHHQGKLYGAYGRTEDVRMALGDYQADHPGVYDDCVVVRLPRRLTYDQYLHKIGKRTRYAEFFIEREENTHA